jgi:hypothetical protein
MQEAAMKTNIITKLMIAVLLVSVFLAGMVAQPVSADWTPMTEDTTLNVAWNSGVSSEVAWNSGVSSAVAWNSGGQ